MRKLIVLALALGGCAHGIRKMSDCQKVQGADRVECGACVAPNEAQGWLGTNEYRPDAKPGDRCKQVK